MTSTMMEVAALGRPFTLGILYDARKDQLVPGLTLWDEKSLKDNLVEEAQHSSDFQISTSDSLEEKSSVLEVGASLKASILGGLVELGASAKYLNDKKTSRHQSRVTLYYKATTTFKQLNISTEEKKAIRVDDDVKRVATHVVTGILYGAKAFLVCDTDRLDSSTRQKVEASIQATINMVVANVKAEVETKFTEEQKAVTNMFHCKFYGDLIPDSNPATFEDAVKTYQSLPKLLGTDKKTSVPVKVWMMPLKMFDQEAQVIMSGLSTGLVRKAQDALEDFHELRMRCSDCLEDSYNFPQIHETLTRFKKLCAIYTQKLQEMLAKKIPSIRAGKEDESEMLKILDSREKSPFSSQTLEEWMSNMEKEVSVIRLCVAAMDGVKIAPKKLDVDADVYDPNVEEVLCFVFTSLKSADPFVQKMSDYLDRGDLGAAEEVKLPGSENEWYMSNEASLRAKARDFGDLAKRLKETSRYRFLVTAINNEKHRGATIYHYHNNALLTEDFIYPANLNVETITNRRDLMWYATDLSLDVNTAHAHLTISDGDKKATVGAVYQSYPDHPDRFESWSVLCKQELTGRHYWEVEWGDCESGHFGAGVAYRRIHRKGDSNLAHFGGNDVSWCFMKNVIVTFTIISAYHNDVHDGQTDSFGSVNRLGVYLDWPAGTLSFYQVSGDQLRHFFTYRKRFSEPLLPGLCVNGFCGTSSMKLK